MECRDPRAFAMLCAAMFFIYSDQNLMAPNLTAIGHFFGYSDDERDAKLGGQISVAFFLLGLPAALIIGVLCDVVERKRVLVWTLIIGQGPCLLTVFVTEFWQLFILRTLTGVAVGGALPLVYSISGDLFPPSSRSYASAVVGICSSLGGMAGQGVAGFLGPRYGWRLPFAVVAAPGLLVAYLVHAFAEEPARGGADRAGGEGSGGGGSGGDATGSSSGGAGGASGAGGGSSSAKRPVAAAAAAAASAGLVASFAALLGSFFAKTRRIMSRPTNVLGFLQGIPGCVPWSIIGVFMNDYLAVDKGLGVELATSLMMAFGLGAMFGTISGGVLGQWLYNARRWFMTAFMGVAAVAGIFPWLYLVDADDYGSGDGGVVGFKFFVAAVAGCLASMTGVNVRAMTVNVNAPRDRGTAFAWFNLTDDLGKGLGPVLSAWLIGKMGRERAFRVGFWFWLPCGALCAACGLTMRADEEAAAKLAEADERASPEGEDRPLLGGGDKNV